MLASGNAGKMDIVISTHRDLRLGDSLEASETPLRYIFMLVKWTLRAAEPLPIAFSKALE